MQAQRLHVLDILVNMILGDIAARRTALPAMVEIDELHTLAERIEAGLQIGMVAAGAAMDDEGRRLLAHARTIGDQTRAFDVEIDVA